MTAPRQQIAERVVGVVLAGGRATRLGALAAGPGGKGAVMLDGRTFLEAVLAAVAPHVERIVVVAGHRDAATAAALPVAAAATAMVPVEIIHDSVPDGGPLAALADALRHLTSSPAAVAGTAAIVVSCDVPLVRPLVVRLLLDRLRTSDARWVVPQVHGHPQVLLSALRADIRVEIEAHLARGRRDPRGLLATLAETDPAAVQLLEAHAFTTVDPALDSFRDVDTPEDLAAVHRPPWHS